jgi:hypothetical protein
MTGKTERTATLPGWPEVPVYTAPAWRALAAAEVGESHLVLTPPLPCQDACAATAAGRPLLIVADGLGSRPLSHIGADAVVRLVPCYLAGQEEALASLLDAPLPPEAEYERHCQALARGVVRFAAAVLDDLGRQMGHDGRAFQCTLLLAVTGRGSVFWLQVGDGDLVFEQPDGGLVAASRPDPAQPADLTLTVRVALQLPQLLCGLKPAAGVSGIAACSDGAGERLVARGDGTVAPLLGRFLADLRVGILSPTEVLDFLRDREIWHKTSRDDRSLALIARRDIGPLPAGRMSPGTRQRT